MFPLRGVLFFKETGTTNTLTSNYFVRVILGEWKILHSIFWRAWCILVSKEAITCHGKTPFQLLEKSVRLVAVDRGRFLHHPHSQLMQNLFSNWRGAELPHYCRSYLWKIIIIWVVWPFYSNQNCCSKSLDYIGPELLTASSRIRVKIASTTYFYEHFLLDVFL